MADRSILGTHVNQVSVTRIEVHDGFIDPQNVYHYGLIWCFMLTKSSADGYRISSVSDTDMHRPRTGGVPVEIWRIALEEADKIIKANGKQPLKPSAKKLRKTQERWDVPLDSDLLKDVLLETKGGYRIRALNVMRQNDIRTLREISLFSRNQIGSWKNCGEKTVQYIEKSLKKVGLRLAYRGIYKLGYGESGQWRAQLMFAPEMLKKLLPIDKLSKHAKRALGELRLVNVQDLLACKIANLHHVYGIDREAVAEEIATKMKEIGVTWPVVL